MLYDAHGNPVQTRALREEHGGASTQSVRSPHRASVASGLRPERLANILRAADAGNTVSAFTLAEEMEERDLHYRSVLSTRKLAVSGLEPCIEGKTDKRTDRKIADAVRECIVETPEFEGLITDLLDAIAKGVSAVEIMWDTSERQWCPRSYEWRDQRWFAWDLETLSRPLLRTDDEPMGVPLAPFKWALHAPKLKSGLTLRAGISRVAMVAFMLKAYTLRDLMAFMECFGMPIRVGKYGTGTSAEEKKDLLRALANIGTDAAAAIPESMQIEFIEAKASAGGDKLFIGAADWWDKQVSKVVLGQTMTADNGSSLSQAKVHNEVRLDLRRADARAVAATITRDIITPFVRLNFGEGVEVPRLRLHVDDPEEVSAFMANVKLFVDMGGKVEQSFVRDRLGIPEPDEGAEVLGSAAANAADTEGEDDADAAAEGAEPQPPEEKAPAADE